MAPSKKRSTSSTGSSKARSTGFGASETLRVSSVGVEIVVGGFEHNRAIWFEECLPRLFRFLDMAIGHLLNTKFCGRECLDKRTGRCEPGTGLRARHVGPTLYTVSANFGAPMQVCDAL